MLPSVAVSVYGARSVHWPAGTASQRAQLVVNLNNQDMPLCSLAPQAGQGQGHVRADHLLVCYAHALVVSPAASRQQAHEVAFSPRTPQSAAMLSCSLTLTAPSKTTQNHDWQ